MRAHWLPQWLRLPGHTVRVRLTALYGILFVLSGALLLAIASGVAVGSSSVQAASPGQGRPGAPPAGSALAQAQARIHNLQDQLSPASVAAVQPAGSAGALARAAARVPHRARRS